MENKISKLPHKRLRHLVSTPFILGMAVPIVFLDVSIEIYHHVSFPLYGIPLNKRHDYIKIDRQKLAYLGFLDKIWCTYCGYANGLMPYATKITADTEKYWCGIKHKSNVGYAPPHHKEFLNYDDETAYREYIEPDKQQKL
jgi:hypothetical protein